MVATLRTLGWVELSIAAEKILTFYTETVKYMDREERGLQ